MKNVTDLIWDVFVYICFVLGFAFIFAVLAGVILRPFYESAENQVKSTETATNDFSSRYIAERRHMSPVLPDGAKNMKDRGNGWMTFEFDMDGETKTFLFARYSNGSTTITQIK